jgi:hypothetical protein
MAQRRACENTSVTYVFTFTNFFSAAERIRSPDPRIVRLQKWSQRHHCARILAARMYLI